MSNRPPQIFTQKDSFVVDPSLISIAKKTLLTNMGLKSKESLLIVTDSAMASREGAFWFEAGKQISQNVVMMVFDDMKENAQEPPNQIRLAMEQYDVVMLQTTYSLSHTKARQSGCLKGARMASLPGATLDILKRTLNSDYHEIKHISQLVAQKLTLAKKIFLTSPNGTNFSADVTGRIADPDFGLYTKAGDFGNLPAGESYIAPLENTARGVYIVDGSFAGITLDQPIRIEVVDGFATNISGGKSAQILTKQLNAVGSKARNIAEIGIGTNHTANPKNTLIEAEKAYGTVHIALGDNHTFGGNVSVPYHSDGVIIAPTLIVDCVAIIKDGEFNL